MYTLLWAGDNEMKRYTYRATILSDYPFASNDGRLHRTEDDAKRHCHAMNEANEVSIEDLEAASDRLDRLPPYKIINGPDAGKPVTPNVLV